MCSQSSEGKNRELVSWVSNTALPLTHVWFWFDGNNAYSIPISPDVWGGLYLIKGALKPLVEGDNIQL